MFTLPLGDGSHEQWIESAVRMGSGHITIQAPGFQTSRKIEDRLSAEARAAAETALREPGVAEHLTAVTPQLAIGGLASSSAGALPAHIIAVDPVTESAFSVLDEKRVKGRYLEPEDRLAAYVGVGLAESLERRVGARLVLTAQDANGDIAGQLVRVVGVFQTGIPEVDRSLIHIPLSTAGAWLQTGDDVTTLAVLLDVSTNVPPLIRALRGKLTDPIERGELKVMSWREANPELDAAVKVDDLGNYIFQGILFGIIALGIVNTVLTSVLYRHREFSLLQALGLTRLQAGGLVLIEGLILTLSSGIVGITLGLFITWFFWRDGLDFSSIWNEEWSFAGVVIEPIVIPFFRVARVVQALVFILTIGVLASLYPAYRASRINIIEAMKFER